MSAEQAGNGSGGRTGKGGKGERPPAAGRSPFAAFLAALRISRRDIRRARGRSALIMVMIGLPVMLFSGAATWLATEDIAPHESLAWDMGAADARLDGSTFGEPVRQSADGNVRFDEDGAQPNRNKRRDLSRQEIVSLFGPGSRAVPSRTSWTGYQGPRGYREIDVREIDLSDPITAGMYRLLSGRLPRAAGEIAVNPGLGLRPGTEITLSRTSSAATVVGVVESQRYPHHRQIVAPPGTVLADGKRVTTEWLVDTPAPVSWQKVRELNRKGLVVASRAVITDPPPSGDMEDPAPGDPWRLNGVVMAVTGVGLVVLEVALLAGPAFAVGIRRRRRELALIAAQGGSARHLRWIVLADGLTLGPAASVPGAALGVAVVAAMSPFVHRGPFDVPLNWVVLVALLGVASGLLAALVPAVQAARTNAVTVLAGRRGRAVGGRGRPVAGLALVAVGLALIGHSAQNGSRGFWSAGDAGLLAGFGLGQLGLVLLTPWLVRAAAGTAARLPLPLRMAARDAARNRSRTAPAVAAVMAAVAAFTATAVMASSDLARAEERDFPSYLPGSAVVRLFDAEPRLWTEVKQAAAEALPGVPFVEAGDLAEPGRSLTGVWVTSGDCGEPCPALHSGELGPLPVGGVDLLRHVLRGTDPVAEAAFAEGKAVVFDPRLIEDGKVSFETRDEAVDVHSLPAVAVRDRGLVPVAGVLPSRAVAGLGLEVRHGRLIVDPAVHRTSAEEIERLDAVVREVSFSANAQIDDGIDRDSTAVLLVLAVAATVLVLGGTFAATGLAAVEGRPDRTTLAAVGAPARVQRLLVAGQAAFIAGLGVVTGMVAGMVPAVADAVGAARHEADWRRMLPDPERPDQVAGFLIDVPWPALAAMLVGLPLAAALLAGLCTRTRLPLTRRLS
ncbi:FtsX-like permease family protein [Planobispora siamensis]|uniref:ABC3 transporter permease C-terminal domain-containing protein n=1 Tax=Planobispora siamensis TaxID=936338 RepID=A0A8J3WJ27_9ACTN|nr:FtsX-like permease family protein [Planobispora siamensis]GIH92464.1 hypothetical protein Psi01_30940 [Planobispora siamensis]